MRFVMDGEEFELTAAHVRSRLRGHVPGDIREYWVEVDGVRWPVKQVLAIATGTSRSRFITQTAVRHLGRLGFTVGGGEPAHSEPAGPYLERSPAASPSLRRLETLSVCVAFDWCDAGTITLDGTNRPVFPALPRSPGLYRFWLEGGKGTRDRVYIGESTDLARRASNYRNAATDRSRQLTSRRIHKELVEHLAGGNTVNFAIATEITRGLDGEPIDLRLKAARHLAESAAVLQAQTTADVDVLNIDIDLTRP